MKKFIKIINGVETSDARSAFYYLGRYLKQAEHYSRYEKDFFEDDYQSRPSKAAKKLTFELIDFIENYQNKKVSEFTDEEYLFWLYQLNEAESKLEPEPTKAQVESATFIIEDLFQTPSTNSTKNS